jgi:hypothetical protein
VALPNIELDGLDEAVSRHFEVELTGEPIAALARREGQTVRLVPSRLTVVERIVAAMAFRPERGPSLDWRC